MVSIAIQFGEALPSTYGTSSFSAQIETWNCLLGTSDWAPPFKGACTKIASNSLLTWTSSFLELYLYRKDFHYYTTVSSKTSLYNETTTDSIDLALVSLKFLVVGKFIQNIWNNYRPRLLPALQLGGHCGSDTWTRVTFVSVFLFRFALIPLCYRNYVNQQTSIQQNLTYASQNAFVLRADHNKVLGPNGPGRNSVRIQSKNAYGNHVVM